MRWPSQAWLWFATGALAGAAAFAAATHVPDVDDEIVGEEDFRGAGVPESGLGPLFNARSCDTCHYLPRIGGTGAQVTLRLGFPGPVPAAQSTFPSAFIGDARCQPKLPASAVIIARRIPTPLYGAGLVEAIPDRAIEAMADPDDRDGDGVRGRVARVRDAATGEMRVGRFGWKAQDASLLAAVARAYAREMGETNKLFPNETIAGLSAEALRECDRPPDPEDFMDESGMTVIERLALFVRQLAPLPGRAYPMADAGAGVFADIGCATCHRPAIDTGTSIVHAYSDFLLHDVGTGDGIPEEGATADDMRTAPLWGVGTRRFLMHDGRAIRLEGAIKAHGGEAAAVRDRFAALPAAEREALIAFLRGL